MNEQFVKSFDEACTRLAISNELPDVSAWPVNLQKHLTATYMLSKILEVNNGDWKPDLGDTNQWKYYPWFEIIKDGSSGFRLSYRVCGCVSSRADLGVRLACKSSELAEFMGETFPEIYKDLLS